MEGAWSRPRRTRQRETTERGLYIIGGRNMACTCGACGADIPNDQTQKVVEVAGLLKGLEESHQ